MKFSSRNKRGDKFQPILGYIGYIIYKKMNYYNSRYFNEEQAAFKAKYFTTRKAKGVRIIEKTFRSYLAYIKGINLNLDQNRTISGYYLKGHENINSDTLINNDDLLNDSDDSKSNRIINFTTVFRVSNVQYNAREVIR